MRLFDVPLKIMRNQNLVDSQQYAELVNDTKSWEDSCAENSEDKMKVMYHKIHKGPFVRLLMPFLYLYVLRMFIDLNTSGSAEDLFED